MSTSRRAHAVATHDDPGFTGTENTSSPGTTPTHRQVVNQRVVQQRQSPAFYPDWVAVAIRSEVPRRVPSPRPPAATHRRARRVVAGTLAPALLAAAPSLLLLLRVLWQRPPLVLSGDQALVEMDVQEAAHFDASLGVYSRFGWHHPGPSWFYLLAGPYRLLGGASWALVAAVLLLNAVAAALVVVAVAALAGPEPRGVRAGWLTACVLVVFCAVLGLSVVQVPWNPYAVVLPMLLFLVLCCGAMLGHRGWFVAAALVGTFLVQTHIGTAPVVAAGLLLVAATCAGAAIGWPPARPRLRRPRLSGWTGAGLALLVLAWVPPLIDQLAGTRNLSRVHSFEAAPQPIVGWHSGVSAVGALMSRLITGLTGPWPATLNGHSEKAVLVLVAVAGATVLLLAVGWRRHDRLAQACGAVAATSLVATVVAAHSVVGPLKTYLLLWACAIPAVLAIGWVTLLAGARMPHPALRGATLAAALAAALVAFATLSWPPLSGVSRSAVAQAVGPTQQQLRLLAPGADSVLIRLWGQRHGIRIWGQWAAGVGLAEQLRSAGWQVYFTDDAADLFGEQYRLRGPVPVEIDVVDSTTAAQVGRLPGARAVPLPVQPYWVYVRPTPGRSVGTGPAAR